MTTTVIMPGGRSSSSSGLGSGSGSNIMKNVLGIRSVLSVQEIETIKSSWEALKKKGDFAPKVFMRYLKSKPESQRLFPTFSHVAMSDLPGNSDFLNQVKQTCFQSSQIVALIHFWFFPIGLHLRHKPQPHYSSPRVALLIELSCFCQSQG